MESYFWMAFSFFSYFLRSYFSLVSFWMGGCLRDMRERCVSGCSSGMDCWYRLELGLLELQSKMYDVDWLRLRRLLPASKSSPCIQYYYCLQGTAFYGQRIINPHILWAILGSIDEITQYSQKREYCDSTHYNYTLFPSKIVLYMMSILSLVILVTSIGILILLMMSHLQMNKLHQSCDISNECRALALPVAAPVYHQYNYIDLRKNSRSRRIDRLVLSELPSLTQSKSESGRRDRWQHSLDRYMLAKEQLQSRRAQSQSSKFDFLRLNKINQYRKQKLVEAQSLPLSMIRSTDLNQTYSFDLDPEITSKARRVSTQKNTLKHSPKQELPQQERILNSILQSYFKKKYSLPQRLRPLKNKNISSVIIKKQNRKIKF